MKKVMIVALAALAVSMALPEVSAARPPEKPGSGVKPPTKLKSFKGTIQMECRQSGGKLVCKPLTERVIAENEPAARRELRKKFELRARAEDGKLIGEAVLTIEF